jgi:cytochrome c biogenesis protein CcdA
VVGALIALLWDAHVTDPLATQFQRLTVGTLVPSNADLAVALAFVSGMSMIVTACGWPMILNLTAIAQTSKNRRGWLLSAGSYALGLMIVMSVVGALVGLAGGIFVGALSQLSARLTVTVVIYTIVGLYALLGALQEFRFIDAPWLFPWFKQPKFVSGLKGYRQSFAMGAVIGGGFGVGCPFPTYQAVLLFVVAIGSPFVGALALAANAMGRVIPIFLAGSLIIGGLGAKRTFSWIQRKSYSIHMINGLALAVMAAFMILYWTVLVGGKFLLGLPV